MDASADGARQFSITRRAFLQAAVATGAAVALPLVASRPGLAGLFGSSAGAAPGPLNGGEGFFLRSAFEAQNGQTYDLYATAKAICARIVPTTTNPLTGKVSPGATEAGAVNYIDVFMAAFDDSLLTSSLVNTNPIFLNGRFSGRYNFGDPTTGTQLPGALADDFEASGSATAASGIEFLGLTDAEAVVWYLRIYGAPGTDNPGSMPPWPSWASSDWKNAVTSGLVPGATALRPAYEQGLPAFDDWSGQNFGRPFADASPAEQDALLLIASNPVLGAASGAGFPGLPAPLVNPVPPAAAANLFGTMVLHTIQGTYGLPEYRGQADLAVNGTAKEPTAGTIWADIGWDGDTQPLGNSIYRYDPAGSLNSGYPHATYHDTTGRQQPQGGYVQFRPVDSPEPGDLSTVTSSEIAELFDAMEKAGVLKITNGGAL